MPGHVACSINQFLGQVDLNSPNQTQFEIASLVPCTGGRGLQMGEVCLVVESLYVVFSTKNEVSNNLLCAIIPKGSHTGN